MSLIAKLWGGNNRRVAAVKQIVNSESGIKLSESVVVQQQQELLNCANNVDGETTIGDKNSLNFGSVERVRILLFRECEWRGRKLLFDSIAAERSKQRCSENSCNEHNNNNNNSTTASKCLNVVRNGLNTAKSRQQQCDSAGEAADGIACEHGKLLSEDVSLLSEMIFGTVAMTYRGPSFKIHAMNSPGSIMCTKVFPFSEHSVCSRSSERYSSENLTTSATFDSNSSGSSTRTHSRPGSGNSLSPGSLRKSSTCSSTGSGWDIDVPRLGSSQSLDGASSCASGSLSSLRRRWLRVITTSLTRSESDEAFVGSYCESPDCNEVHARKHKTRLGLAMLLQLPSGHDAEISSRLFEHSPLLEGILDRLRYHCVEGRKGPERTLVARLYRATNSCTLRLLRLLMSLRYEATRQPLVWHELLLSSSLPASVQVNEVYRSLQQMCRLLVDFDTKSTNFFLSTIVTAVLTHHLGWVHTAPPHRNRHLVEILGQQYPCNPFWAQLNDLYGSIGTPARIAHTVIAGEPDKAQLIESVLNFLGYFLRSGIVEKRQESRDPSQEDVQEAIAILERTLRNNPALEQQLVVSTPSKRAVKSTPVRRMKQLEVSDCEVGYSLTKSKSYEEPRKGLKFELGSENSSVKSSFSIDVEKMKKEPSTMVEPKPEPKKLKRSGTLQKSLSEYAKCETETSSKVTIIVSSDESERKKSEQEGVDKTDGGNGVAVDEEDLREKLALISQQQKLGELDLDAKTLDDQSLFYPWTLMDESSSQTKTQVYFTLGGEEKPNLSIRERLSSICKCQCSYTFTRVPSTSAELPEGVLRKIIQRNFPESSKNMQPTTDDVGLCPKCRRGYAAGSSQNGKLMLETPTNATEVLRGCASSSSSDYVRSNSLETLIEASCVIELPMPRSTKMSPLLRKKSSERVGFSKSLLATKVLNTAENTDSGYTWGMAIQGFTKKKRGRRKPQAIIKDTIVEASEKPKVDEKEWWWPIREGLGVEAKFPLVDQPVSEALCIIGDLDNWQVGLLSNTSGGPTPTPVGMSRLVSNMLEAFAFVWKEFRSPEQCIKLLESRLREMWLRSETLAEFLLAANLDDANVGNLTSFLDVDAADLPLLLAVATTHSPQIAQRFGLSLA